MKKLFILFAILMIAVVSLFAQVPQKFSYQAVVRDAGNNLVVNHAVGVRISILQGGDERLHSLYGDTDCGHQRQWFDDLADRRWFSAERLYVVD